MSRKQKLSKKIAHTLLAMAIVYSGGMNVVCNTTFAAPGVDGANGTSITASEDISGGIDRTYGPNNGGAGTAGSDSDKGGDGGNGGSVTLDHTVTGTLSGAIAITANGGDGGRRGECANHGYFGVGGSGGDSSVVISVAGDGITTSNNITVTAKAGSCDYYTSEGKNRTDIDTISTGKGGAAKAIGLQADDKSSLATITAVDITISAIGGTGAPGISSYSNGGVGGIGGAAEAYGLKAATSLLDLNINDIKVEATGGGSGTGGEGGAGANTGNGNTAGEAGIATAWGVQGSNSAISGNIKSVAATATGGAGGTGGTPSSDGIGGISSRGADAQAYAIGGSANTIALSLTDTITAKAIGGAGGGGSYGSSAHSVPKYGKGADGGDGAEGGTAYAYGLQIAGSEAVVTASSLISEASGGQGGQGASGGGPGRDQVGDEVGDGGDGGNGGDATAYAAYADNSKLQMTVDTVTATATAGSGGSAGAGATEKGGYPNNGPLNNATPGTDGVAGAAGKAKAYGIYATNGSTVDLKAKSAGTITIAATATAGISNEAYAVYAADSNVTLHDNVNITGGTTFLQNSRLAFEGQTADRTLNSFGELKLAGSNEFRVTTDLANNTADKFTFAKLADNSSTDKQYITVGYDKSFDGSNLTSLSGTAVVLNVTDLNSQNLDNFAGKTSTLDAPLTRFTATPTVEVDGNDVKITQIDFAQGDASETVMTASDAHMALGSMWRIEGNNLMKRMGELRSDSEAAQGGVWARYYRGELSADSAYGREFNQDYTAFQGGIDKVQDYKGGKLYTGIAVNRIDSNAGYKAGSGDLSSTGVGLYASWLGSKGHYVDVIARGSKLANDFKLVDLSGNAAKGDYDTWAYGISAEYGYRQNLKAGWFVEPQAELSLGHIGSVDYTTSNDVTIKQDSVNSAVTRLGVLGGKEFSISGRPGNAYVKASVLHDFGGNGGATGYYKNDSLALQTGDLTGTWYELGLGANLGIAKNGNLYFDALKTFNGNLRTDWQFNAGLRFTF